MVRAEGSEQGESLTLGVTGHRVDLLSGNDIPQLRCQVRSVLTGFVQAYTGPLTLVSSLAEGADQLVAEEALLQGFGLISPLPFARDVYEQDFVRQESVASFRRLLGQATEVEELPGRRNTSEVDDEAYARAGARMLERIDVLLAIWNGGAARGVGGTAEIVATARARKVPIVWIRATAPYDVRVLAAASDQKVALQEILRRVVDVS
jgi:hypothetical protein